MKKNWAKITNINKYRKQNKNKNIKYKGKINNKKVINLYDYNNENTNFRIPFNKIKKDFNYLTKSEQKDLHEYLLWYQKNHGSISISDYHELLNDRKYVKDLIK